MIASTSIMESQKLPRNISSFEHLLKLSEVFGYGLVCVKSYDAKQIVLEASSTLSKQYQKLFSSSCADHFLAGFCTGISEQILGKTMKGEIADSIIKISLANDPQGELRLGNLSSITSSFSQTEASKKIIGHDLLSYNSGWFLIAGIPGHVYGNESFVLMYHLLQEKYGDEFTKVLYTLGKAQSRQIGKYQIEKFGLDKNQFLNIFVQQSEMQGIGVVSIEDSKDGRFLFRHERNTFALKHLNHFGKASNGIDFYMCGLLCGAVEAIFGTEYEGQEIQCMAKKAPYCSYELHKSGKSAGFDPLIEQALSFSAMLPAI
ncbi:MAG TPA: 4-vinyl reductase [Candidatus Nanoarchaeia archaeon]|nr:4-vinyl reductase [Candidatus Nanoarchaeia archaeon]